MPDESSPSTQKLTVRLPRDVRERIRVAAEASGRTLNGELVARVVAGLDGGGVDVDELAERIVDALVARLAAGATPAARPAKRKR